MPDPVSGLIAAGTSVVSSSMQADAAESAAATQSASAAEGIAEQRRQFDEVRKLLSPYVEVGTPALAGQRALIGLSGPAAQQQAIAGLESSPLFQAAVNQGENALLQRASATGGLRGGNIQAALAQFRPQMLQAEIERQYSRLGGLTSLGQQSAAGVGTAGTAMGVNVGNLMQQQGAAQAGGQLAQGAAYGGGLGSIPQGLGMYYGMTGRSPFGGGSSFVPGGTASSGFGTGAAFGNQDFGLSF